MRVLLTILVVLICYCGFAQKKPAFGKAPKVKTGNKNRTYNGDVKLNKSTRQNRSYKSPKLDKRDTDWTKTRLEFIVGTGPTSFLGDLGGQDGPGRPFIYDFEPTQTRYVITGGVRYFLREYHAIKGTVSYARVRGDDATTNYPNRRYRNLNFKSPIIEFSGNYEFYILRPKTLHFAGARSTHIWNGNRLGIYASAGAGFFIFNPKTKLNGQWYALKPMSTEGQGLPDGPAPYRRFGATFPIGGGVTYQLNWNYTIGLDFGYRWTTTDYIDDASGYYYDNDVIRQNKGKLAATLANPSVLLDDVPEPDWYTKDQPRGGSLSNDTYLFTQITLSHSFEPAVTNKPIKQKKKKVKQSYKEKTKKNKKGRKARAYDNKRIKNKKRRFKAPKLDFGKKRKRSKIRTF